MLVLFNFFRLATLKELLQMIKALSSIEGVFLVQLKIEY